MRTGYQKRVAEHRARVQARRKRRRIAAKNRADALKEIEAIPSGGLIPYSLAIRGGLFDKMEM